MIDRKYISLALRMGCLILVGCLLGCSANGHREGKELPAAGAATESMTVEPEESLTVAVPTSAPTPEPTKEPAPEITLVMVGDILLHTPVEEASRQEDGSYCYDAIFAHTREEIAAADIAIVNQEVIIGGEELGISGYPAFNAAYSMGDALVNAGFDVVCHGTNHALDKGRRGLLNCISYWESTHPEMGILGIHDSQKSQDSVYIYEQEGIRVAILNYTYGTNGIPLPEDMPYGVDYLEEDKVMADIAKAEEMADFTIVCPHWGTEYQLEQSSYQERWAELFLESGVDLVIGTHPHVIQPIEWLEDGTTGHRMLVYYSLGNFVNWTSESGPGIANRMVGGMAQVTLTKEDEGLYISEYGVEPVISHLEPGTNGVTVYRLADYTQELASRNQIIHQDDSFTLEYCKKLCEDVWPQLMSFAKE